MKKIILGIIAIVTVVAVAGFNVYSAQNPNYLSALVLANVEALADDGEIPNTNCTATWNQECCVCFGRHHTYARPTTDTGACEHRTGCSHY